MIKYVTIITMKTPIRVFFQHFEGEEEERMLAGLSAVVSRWSSPGGRLSVVVSRRLSLGGRLSGRLSVVVSQLSRWSSLGGRLGGRLSVIVSR